MKTGNLLMSLRAFLLKRQGGEKILVIRNFGGLLT